MRALSVSIISLLAIGPAVAQKTWPLQAVDSVSISRANPYVFTDNRMRAYNNPNQVTYHDIHGVFRFDVSAIPDSTQITAMKLTLYMENAYGSPKGGPIVNLHWSADDAWSRATATPKSAALGPIVCANQTSFVHPKHVFTIDLTKHDFSADLRDDAITLVVDNVNPAYSYVYFFGHTGSPVGSNAVLEITGSPCSGTVTAFGTGGKDCTATEHRLSISGCPAVGQRVQVTAQVGQFIQLPILLFAGGSNTSWLTLKLPFDLTALGAPGNSIYVSLDAGLGTIPNPGGGGSVTLPIPNDSRLKNATVYFQTILFGCGANSLRLVFSNGTSMTIG